MRSFGHLWSVCEIVLVPYVDAVVAVTVISVLLFILHVCMLRECESASVTEIMVWLWCMQGMWVVHMGLVLWLTQLTLFLLFAFQSGPSQSSIPASTYLSSRIASTGLFHKSDGVMVVG